tara:strand:- start:228 stop:587 length:360 start_codon:yes stop_codon:yes gene_type:complete
MKIIYDGDCPFCSKYVRLIQLKRTVGDVELINARSDSLIKEKLRRLSIDVNQGMVLIDGKDIYFAEDCLHRLALLSTSSTLFNSINKFVFKHKILSNILYPIMKTGRNLTLFILNRKKI